MKINSSPSIMSGTQIDYTNIICAEPSNSKIRLDKDINYRQSPVHSLQSEVDLSDADPTYNDSSLRRSFSSSTNTSDRDGAHDGDDAIVSSE